METLNDQYSHILSLHNVQLCQCVHNDMQVPSKISIFQKGIVEKFNTKFNVKLFYTLLVII